MPQNTIIEGIPRLDGAVVVLGIFALGLFSLVYFAASIPVAVGFLSVGGLAALGCAIALANRKSLLDTEARTVTREFRPFRVRFSYPFTDFLLVRRVLEDEGEGGPWRIDVTFDRHPPSPTFVFASFSNLRIEEAKAHVPSDKLAGHLALLLGVQCKNDGFDRKWV